MQRLLAVRRMLVVRHKLWRLFVVQCRDLGRLRRAGWLFVVRIERGAGGRHVATRSRRHESAATCTALRRLVVARDDWCANCARPSFGYTPNLRARR